MRWEAWRPTYARILADFGYDERADAAARDELDALLSERPMFDLASLRDRLAGSDAWVVGPALSPEAFARIPADASVLVTDGAAGVALPRLPDPVAVVTDLDGDLPAQRAANARGVPLVVHAHGDNRDTLAREVPRLTGPVAGSTQTAPRGRVACFGGFTDGDRAACLAVESGATGIVLVGHDFDAPVAKGGDAAMKARKLAWARRIIHALGVPVRAA